MKHSQSILEEGQLPLEQKKRKIQRNLRTLEQAGVVSSENKYQEIINEIAKVAEIWLHFSNFFCLFLLYKFVKEKIL